MPTLGQKMRQNAKESKQKRNTIEELEKLLDGYDPAIVAAVLAKRAENNAVAPNEKPKKDRIVTIIEDGSAKHICPKCGNGTYNRYGYDGKGFPRFRCTSCGRTYGAHKNSLVAGASWSYEIWASFVYHTLMEHSLAQIKQSFQDDYDFYITEETLLAHRHRLFDAIALCFPMPKLSGIVQIDETFYRESQKGSRNLVNVSPKYIEERLARGPDSKIPSKFGIQGPEFSCVVVGIDSNGYIAAVFTGLGRNCSVPFEEYFGNYIGNVEILCTDGFPSYAQYCDINNVPHYVQVSTARDTIKREKNAYEERYGVSANDVEIRRKLYGKRELDYIDNFGHLSFDAFEKMKMEKGLSLDRVDRVHRQMKRFINGNLAGVSTVNLSRYIHFYCFRHNWQVEHNALPTSQKAAKVIFEKILLSDIQLPPYKESKIAVTDLEQVSTHFVRNLAKTTDELQTQMEDRGFVLGDGDTLLRFDKRIYFRTAPRAQLYEIAKEHHIKGRSGKGVEWLASEICKLPECNEIFLQLIASDALHAKYSKDISAIIEKENERKAEAAKAKEQRKIKK